jgi:hypothetical protein
VKKLFLTISIFSLLLFIAGVGCEKDKRDPLCYKGKVVSINNTNGCYNIIEIIETIKNEGLSKGSTISFGSKIFEGELLENDIVYFKILQYEDWVGPAYANCLWPRYTAQIELCND